MKLFVIPALAAGISLRPAPESTLVTRPQLHIGVTKRIEIPALRAGMTELVDYAKVSVKRGLRFIQLG